MNRSHIWKILFISAVLLFAGAWILRPSPAAARGQLQADADVIQGALLYDDWTVVAGVTQPPAGNMPLWDTQSSSTRGGIDTYRCSTCHGWDYAGKDGASGSGANFTGFPGVLSASQKSTAEIIAALGNAKAKHDFSAYLTSEQRAALAAFIQQGVQNDNPYIDLASYRVKSGDSVNGSALYAIACESCHAADGSGRPFRYEGQEVTLGTLAQQDPWRFLHRTRFGTARAPDMPVGISLGWSAEDGRDVLLHAQSFPAGFETDSTPVMEGRTPVAEQAGGPANWWNGILTALGAMATGLGFAILLGAALIGIIFLVVWVIKGKK